MSHKAVTYDIDKIERNYALAGDAARYSTAAWHLKDERWRQYQSAVRDLTDAEAQLREAQITVHVAEKIANEAAKLWHETLYSLD